MLARASISTGRRWRTGLGMRPSFAPAARAPPHGVSREIQAVRRRDDGAGARSRSRALQNRPALGLCRRRQTWSGLDPPGIAYVYAPDHKAERLFSDLAAAEHMPSSHRRYRDWTHERIRSEAAKVGPDTETLIDVILGSRPPPEQGFRSAIGVLGLVKRYGQERVDAACARALLLNVRSYKSVTAIFNNGTDRTAPPAEEALILFHTNIRDRSYYN